MTFDLDVFVLLPFSKGILVTLSPIYEHLQKKGYRAEGEHIVIEGIPIRFIPAYNELVKEAVNQKAVTVRYRQTQTRLVRVEHLIAIMLQTYRPKDRERLLLLLEQARIDDALLHEVLQRHRLKKRWEEFQRRYK